MDVSGMKDRFASLLQRSPFLRHVLAVSGSTFAVQAISLAVAPITSRLYAPADHGLLALFNACFSLLSILATLRYETALPLARDDTEATHLLLLSGGLMVLMTALVSVACATMGTSLAAGIAHDSRFLTYLWFLPLGLLLLTSFNILAAWAVRAQAFGALSKVRILQSLGGSSASIGLGLTHAGVVGLIAGTVVASLLGLRSLAVLAWRALRHEAQHISWAGLQATARRHYRFPLYNSWAQLINAASLQLPVFALTAAFGAAATGYFSLTQRLLLLPTLLISGAITPVFYSRARQAQADGSLAAFAERVLQGISGVNVFFVVFVALFGEPLFTLVFGAQWTRSGTYAAAMAPWLLLNFMVTPLATLPLVFHRQGTDLLFHALLLTCRCGTLWLGMHYGDDLTTVAAFSLGSAVFMLVYLRWLLQLVGARMAPALWRVARELAVASVLLGGCRALLEWSDGNWWATGSALLPALAYGAWRALRPLQAVLKG